MDSTVYRTLVVTNRANHGRGTRAVVDGGVEEHETMSAFTVPSLLESKNTKILELGQGTTLLIASGDLSVELTSSRRHIKLKK